MTKAERISDTIAWFPSNSTMHIPSSDDRVTDVTQDITISLAIIYPVSPPVSIADTNLNILHQLSNIFTNIIMTPTHICPPSGFPSARPVSPLTMLHPPP